MVEAAPPSEIAAQPENGVTLARVAALVMAGFVFSRVLGLLRDAIIAAVFGNGSAFQAYIAASRPPETIFFVVAGGALGSAFIPTFLGYWAHDKRDDAWRLTSAVISLITLVLAIIALGCAIFAPVLISTVLAPGYSSDVQALTIDLMRIMLLTPVIFGVSGLLMGLLNAGGRFLLPALAPSLYNVGIIAGALVLAPALGIYGLAWGTVLGAVLHLAVQIPGVLAMGFPFRPRLDMTDSGVLEVLRLMGPRVLGLAVVQVNFWVNINLASGMVVGSVGALQRAFMILLLPQGLIAQSIATAVFPTFSSQVAAGKQAELRATLGQVLRSVIFLSIPATVGLILLRVPVVRLLFERQAFTPEDTQATAWALLFFGLGLISHALVEIVTRAFYAMHDTVTPVAVGGGTMVLNILLSLSLIRFVGIPTSLAMGPFAGLALALTLSTTVEAGILLALLLPRLGGLELPAIGKSALQASLASTGMGLLLWAMLPVIDRIGQVSGPLVAIAVGGGVFWGLALLLGSDEARLFTRYVFERLRRRSRASRSA